MSTGAAAQNGIRGLLALHVALFHYLFVPSIELNTFGHAHMSFFMVLSGFGMSAAYGQAVVERRKFWTSRFARTMPVVYLTHASVALLTPLGYGQHPGVFFKTLRHNLAATSMWLLHEGEPAWGWNGPAWTVSTLAAFYWIYPLLQPMIGRMAATTSIGRPSRLAVALLTAICVAHGVVGYLRPEEEEEATTPPGLHREWQVGWLASGGYGMATGLAAGALAGLLAGSDLGHRQLASGGLAMPPWVAQLAWLQFGIGIAMLYHGLPYVGRGYWPATGWVPSRLPLILMGAVAGAARPTEGAAGDAQVAKRWAARTDRATCVYASTLVACSVWHYFKDRHQWKTPLDFGPLVQLALPYLQLVLTVGLARSADRSFTAARVCLHPLSQWLGKVSMAIYLCHMPVYQWLVALIHGPMDWTFGGKIGATFEEFETWHKSCHEYKKLHGVADPDCTAWREMRNLGAWSVPVATVLTLVVAAIVEHRFEHPARKWLQGGTRSEPPVAGPGEAGSMKIGQPLRSEVSITSQSKCKGG